MYVIKPSVESLPIKIWSTPEEAEIQTGAMQQAMNLANHPLALAWISLMPDFHQGYGMPAFCYTLQTDKPLRSWLCNVWSAEKLCGSLHSRT